MTADVATLEREILDEASWADVEPSDIELVDYARWLLRIPVVGSADPARDSPAAFLRVLWGGADSVIAIAGRDSFKTLTLSAYEFLAAHHRGRHILHFAPRDYQADRGRDYLALFSALPHFAPFVEYSRDVVRFASGGSIEVRVLTTGTARSAHTQEVAYDEADECDPQAMAVSVNIASSRRDAPARSIYISTQNHANGIVAKLAKEAAAAGIRVMRWNYKTTAERCDDARSGTAPTTIWVHPTALLARRDAPPQPESWERATVLDRCPECALVASCRADLKHAGGVSRIDDLVARRTHPLMTAAEWLSQVDNLEPSTHGLVVPEFRRERSVRAEVVHDPQLPTVWAQDFGLDHLAVTVVGQVIPIGHRPLRRDGSRGPPNALKGRKVILDEYAVRQTAFIPGIVDWLAANWVPRYGWPSRVFIDPSGAPAVSAARVETVVAGQRVTRTIALEKADNRVKPGIQCLRGNLAPAEDGTESKLTIHPRCVQLVEELETCRNRMHPDGTYEQDVPDKAKGGDDALDAARYLVTALDTMAPHSPAEREQASRRILEGGWF